MIRINNKPAPPPEPWRLVEPELRHPAMGNTESPRPGRVIKIYFDEGRDALVGKEPAYILHSIREVEQLLTYELDKHTDNTPRESGDGLHLVVEDFRRTQPIYGTNSWHLATLSFAPRVCMYARVEDL